MEIQVQDRIGCRMNTIVLGEFDMNPFSKVSKTATSNERFSNQASDSKALSKL